MIRRIHEDMIDELNAGESMGPIVVEQVELAVAPYRWLLPQEVQVELERALRLVLNGHPAGKALMSRLTPSILVSAVVDDTEIKNTRFEGYAIGGIWIALFAHLRKRAKEEGRVQVLLPDTSFRALHAFLCYLEDDGDIRLYSDKEAHGVAGLFCDSVLAPLFLGLVEELSALPARASAWGETGVEVMAVLPRARAILRAAMSRLPPKHRHFLDIYHACDWDEQRASKRLGIRTRAVNARCVQAIAPLCIFLREELERARATQGGREGGTS